MQSAMLSNKYRYYLALFAVYYVGFLLIVPLGHFNPNVPTPASYSLTKIDKFDDTSYYMIAKSIIVDGDLNYSNEQLHDSSFYNLTPIGNPKQAAMIPIGPSILWSPFIFLANILTKLANYFLGAGLSTDGYSKIYIALATIGSSLYGFASLLLSFNILNRYFSPKIAFLSVITVFFGNSLFYFTYIRMLMSHTSEVFAIALFMLSYLRLLEKERFIDYLFLGFSSGFMVIVRYDNAIFLLFPMVDTVFALSHCFRKHQCEQLFTKLKYYSFSVFPFFLVILLQLVHFYIMSGSIIPPSLGTNHGALSQSFSSPINFSELLFSDSRNILWGQPIIIIGLLGCLIVPFTHNKKLGLSLIIVNIFCLCWLFWRPHYYWWGMAFGIRHLIKISLPLAFGYSAIITLIKKKRYLIFGLLSFGIITWEYIKIIQSPRILPILSHHYLYKACSNLYSIVWPISLNPFLGTECSYVRVLSKYAFNLNRFNFNDWCYLIILPITVFILGMLVLNIIFFGENLFTKYSRFERFALVSISSFFIFIFILGVSYPKKSDKEIYNDFRRGAVLSFAENKLSLSELLINQAYKFMPQGDPVLNGFQKLLKDDLFPNNFNEISARIFKIACNDTDPLVSKAGRELEKSYCYENIYTYNFGKQNVRKIMKKGWSTDEGPYPKIGFPAFVWAVGTNASLKLCLGNIFVDKTFKFRLFTFLHGQRMTIYMNNEKIKDIPINYGWHQYSIRVEKQIFHLGKNSMKFEFKRSQAPAEFDGTDSRKLSVAFDWLKIENLQNHLNKASNS